MLLCLNCGKELVKSQKKYCCNKCQQEYQTKLTIEAWKQGEFNGMSGQFGISKCVRDYMIKKPILPVSYVVGIRLIQ